jgi:hypothetical protein
VVPVQVKHGTLRFISKLHFNRVSRIPERILVPAPHFNVVCTTQQGIPRNRFNDLLFMEKPLKWMGWSIILSEPARSKNKKVN